MTRQITHMLKEVRFTGGRFEQNKGWLDFDVLAELQTYKQLLIETAAEEWKRRNPGRERLPRGFAENIRLGFHEIREGSCAVPVERIVEYEQENPLFEPQYVEDEVDEAARIVDQTLIAARDDTPFPERLPASVIPLFGDWGKSLRSGESIVLDGRNGHNAEFNAAIRERLLSTRTERYEDTVDLVGEVRAAELKAREGGAFTVQLQDGDSVSGAFTDEQEAMITEALHEHKQVRIRIVGLGEFDGSRKLRRIVRVEQLQERPAGELLFDAEAPPIWDVVSQIGNSIPSEEWDRVPSDLAANLDHYLYGKAKEERR